MQNIQMEVEKNTLWIGVDLTKRFGPSASGKTIIIASTQGNVSPEGHPDVKVGVNVFTREGAK